MRFYATYSSSNVYLVTPIFAFPLDLHIKNSIWIRVAHFVAR